MLIYLVIERKNRLQHLGVVIMRKLKIDFLTAKDDNTNCILSFSLFSAWLLSFPFLGQVLYCLYGKYSIDLGNLTLIIIAFLLLGQLTAGYIIDNIRKAKRAFIVITYICIAGSLVFFLPYSSLWSIMIIVLSFLGGVYISTWSYYYKLYTQDLRVKAIAKVLILSNIIMVVINVVSINISPFLGLALSIFSLILSLIVLQRSKDQGDTDKTPLITNIMDNVNPVIFLYLFIAIITITSGLMYTVINPAFSHHKILTSIYWAIPYIFAIYILMKSPNKVNRAYVLYVAITLIGLSFLLFLILDRSWISYIIVNTLMMSAFGVCDLFWWSIIGELLDYVKNPAKLLGLGLSANILGIFIGSTLGTKVLNMDNGINSSVIALVIVFIILIILPFLNKHLSSIISDHIFLFRFYNNEEKIDEVVSNSINIYPNLTDRENEIVDLLLSGRTYKMIAEELYLSENTIKTHIKNIYSKYNVNSKAELIKILQKMLITQKR